MGKTVYPAPYEVEVNYYHSEGRYRLINTYGYDKDVKRFLIRALSLFRVYHIHTLTEEEENNVCDRGATKLRSRIESDLFDGYFTREELRILGRAVYCYFRAFSATSEATLFNDEPYTELYEEALVYEKVLSNYAFSSYIEIEKDDQG